MTPETFREFFNQHSPILVGWLTRILNSREDAKEVAQDAFFRLWQQQDRLRNDKPVPYLFTIARNLAHDLIRHRVIEQRPCVHNLEIPEYAPDPEEDDGVQVDEFRTLLMQALAMLEGRQKEIVLLRWKYNLTYPEIGERLGISPSAASTHMTRAVRQIQFLLKQGAITYEP